MAVDEGLSSAFTSVGNLQLEKTNFLVGQTPAFRLIESDLRHVMWERMMKEVPDISKQIDGVYRKSEGNVIFCIHLIQRPDRNISS